MVEACPARAVLESFASGSLAEAERTHAEKHLTQCLVCAEELDRLTRAQLDLVVGHGASTSALRHVPSPVLDTVMRHAAGGSEELPRVKLERVLGVLDPPVTAGALGTFAGYDILDIAGRGGMGVVLKARDRTLDRIVAIKVFSPAGSRDEAFATRFLEEARAVAAIHHDHIVTVHHAGLAKGLAYLVMPFHAEGTLERLLTRTPKLAPREVARLGLQLARGLAATHARNILHRDIKPSNILLEDGLNRVRLADFGLAQSRAASADANGPGSAASRASPALPSQRAIAGTPHYMSPEQARGEVVDVRSDLFGLGAVLYQVAAGRTLYTGESSEEVLRVARRCDHPPLRVVAPDVPAALAATIDRLLAMRPEDRFASATETVAAFDRLVASRGGAWLLAKRVTVGALAACILVGAVILVSDLTGTTAVINTLLCQRTGDTYYVRGRLGTYPRLPGVVAAARPRDVIEARFSGEQLIDSFRLGGKPLTIRAAQGFTPVLVATNNAQPMILVDAPLTLEGLTLWRRGPVVNFAALISVEKAPLHLLNCRILRSRFPGQDVLVWGQLRAVALHETSPRPFFRTLLAFQHGSTGYLRNCVIVGTQATAIGLRSSTNEPTRVDVENSLFVTDRTVFMKPEAATRAGLRFARSVLVTGALLELDETGPIKGIAASWEDCFVDRTGGTLLRLNQAYGGALLRALQWKETNVVYAGQGTFATNRRQRSLDSEAEWNEFLGLTTNSHRLINRQVFSQTCVRSSLALSAADLDSQVMTSAEEAGQKFALRFIGNGDPYTAFRREPAYRQWRRQVRMRAHD